MRWWQSGSFAPMERKIMIVQQTETYAENRTAKRISWGAVFAGVVVALVTQLLLSILGIGIGASTIDPVTEQNPAAGIGIGAGIWFVVSTLIALFAGGWVAGRLAGVPRKTDSSLHGVLTWGVTTLVTFYLLTTAVGALISGAAGVLGKGLSLAGQGIGAVAPQIAEAAGAQLTLDTSSIKEEAKQLLRQTGKPALQPDALARQAENLQQDATSSAKDAAQNPQAAEAELTGLINRIGAKGQKIIDAADRDALINVLVARTSMTRPEATTTVARWEQTYQQLATQYEETKAEVAMKTLEVSGAAASGISKTAIWTFVIFLLGGIAAAFGGGVGTAPALRTDETRTVAHPV